MTELIIGEMNVTRLLREKYRELDKGRITLIEVPIEKHMDINTEALRILINELGFECVYITLSKPFTELDRSFKSGGVDTEGLFFIDAISQMYGMKEKTKKRCVYTSGPIDIDSITSSLQELLSSMVSENKCVFLDSITTVLLYNSLPRTIRFSKFLTQTLKEMDVNGVMVSIAKGRATEKLIDALTKLCDELINIE